MVKNKRFLIIAVCVVICFILILSLCFSGRIAVGISGLRYIFDNPKYTHSSEVLPDSIEFTVNLKEPEKNAGKVIYEKDRCSIKISEVRVYEENNYEIFFESLGTYSYDSAMLISGLNYDDAINSRSTLVNKYNGSDYTCSSQGYSPMCRKDGDSFGYYIFPLDFFTKENVTSVDKIESVTLTLSNIVLNLWTLK